MRISIANIVHHASHPTCHFRKMTVEDADTGTGERELYYECSVCGHTKLIEWRSTTG